MNYGKTASVMNCPGASRQAGISLGLIVALSAVLAGVGATMLHFERSALDRHSTVNYAARVQLGADSLAMQATELQNAVNTIGDETAVNWTDVGVVNGKLALATTTVSYVSRTPVPLGPVRGDNTNIGWTFGSLQSTKSGVPVSDVFAWTSQLGTAHTCFRVNQELGHSWKIFQWTDGGVVSSPSTLRSNPFSTRASDSWRLQPKSLAGGVGAVQTSTNVMSFLSAWFTANNVHAACVADNTQTTRLVVKVATKRM